MKDVVLNEEFNWSKFVERRVKENKKLFTEEEMKKILQDNQLTSKLYLLGILDIKF